MGANPPPLRFPFDKTVRKIKNNHRLTSNCVHEVSILSLGEILVHSIYRVDHNLSIKSIKSILSIPLAPELHPEKPTQLDRRLNFLRLWRSPITIIKLWKFSFFSRQDHRIHHNLLTEKKVQSIL